MLALSRTVWDRPVYALRDLGWKLVYDTRTGREELYDVAADPGEARDLAGTHGVRAAYYRQALQQTLAALRQAAPAAASTPAVPPTKEQCENLKSLGYVSDACKALGF